MLKVLQNTFLYTNKRLEKIAKNVVKGLIQICKISIKS